MLKVRKNREREEINLIKEEKKRENCTLHSIGSLTASKSKPGKRRQNTAHPLTMCVLLGCRRTPETITDL
jgi:hypothetical protein